MTTRFYKSLNYNRHFIIRIDLPIQMPKTGTDNTGTASLDRIDSNKGYVTDNIQWVHKDINYMKSDLDEQQFIHYCRLVVQRQS